MDVNAALHLAARGWRVFPLNDDKTPRTSHGVLDASNKIDQIRTWARQWPNALWGVATGGASGVVVLDVDIKNGKPGAASLASLEAAHGPLPSTLIARTRSGGLHYYFKAPGVRVKNTIGKLGAGLDTRGDGGYVVVPPSTGYSWQNTAQPAELPAWLVHAVERVPTTEAVITSFEPATSELLEQAAALLAQHGPAIEGQRGDAHTWTATCLLARDFALSEDEAWPLLEAWNRTCEPPWDEAELRAKLRNATRQEVTGRYRLDPLVVPWEPTAAEIEAAPTDDDFSGTNSDVGNADLLLKHHGTDLKYIGDWGKWMLWNGRCWELEVGGQVAGRCHKVAAFLGRDIGRLSRLATTAHDEYQVVHEENLAAGPNVDAAAQAEEDRLGAAATEASEKVRGLQKRLFSFQNDAPIRAMLRQASVRPPVAIRSAAFDNDPMLFNAANGTVDLTTGKMRPHARADHATQCTHVQFDLGATCKFWTGFLKQVTQGDEELAEYLQCAAGYTLTGSVKEQCFFFLQGNGKNGKGAFMRALSRVMGPYATTAVKDLLLKRHGSHDSDFTKLIGKRMVSNGEPSKNRKFDDGLVKDLTGGDPLNGRFMRGESFTFVPKFKLWIASNPKPQIAAEDDGMWRRVKHIKFNYRPSDADLAKNVEEMFNASAVLAWMVRGAVKWARSGLNEPGSVRAAVNEYRKQEDIFGQFFEECFELSPGAIMPRQDMRSTYVAWCKDMSVVPDTPQELCAGLRRFQLTEKKSNDTRYWVGVKRRNDPNPKRDVEDGGWTEAS